MPSNALIRTINFSQGVEVDLPVNVLDDSASFSIGNNVSNITPGLRFSSDRFNEVIIDYSIRRRTDLTSGLIERGRLRMTQNLDGATSPEKWILSWDNENDNGALTGVTLAMFVTDNGDGHFSSNLVISSTDLAGANHECVMSYSLTSLLV